MESNDKNPPSSDANRSELDGVGAGGTARGGDREGLGRSRGGLTTAIHLAADSRCRPLALVTSPGQRHGALGFAPVVDAIRIPRIGPGRPRTRPGRVLADKACSRRIRAELRRCGIKATIPEPADQKGHRQRRSAAGGQPPMFDPTLYRQRNSVERTQAAPAPRRRHPLRQTRVRLPRHRHRGRHPHLAPRPRHMIYKTGPRRGDLLCRPARGTADQAVLAAPDPTVPGRDVQ